MASVTATASCPASTLGGVKLSKSPAAAERVGVALKQLPKVGAVIRAQAGDAEAAEKRSSNSRRDIMFGVAAAAMFWSAVSATGEANAADGEPKKGSPEAKKLYAPICVTMPTARICRN
ncbi:photosystem II 5 kDa protein, chloroplastic-like [Nymphaea colorata]|uniref:Photosystem II 5 kDa protein, chloroplastic n=1 Tax=Nymphaea colorata TaxID=210225 RepID=A0A5K1CBX4_9MAGN|nr:photosystem II 5 kDa protein, chloroplastic-like [Nymphaea colorata]